MEKSTRWAFVAYEGQWPLFEGDMPPCVAEWGKQTECCPKTNRLHYQGFIRTNTQVRLSQLIKVFPNVHFEQAKNWDALVAYCNKLDTAIPGTQVRVETQYMTKLKFYDYVLDIVYAEQIHDPDRDIERHKWREMEKAALWIHVENYGNLEIAQGKSYIAFILSDPNFKLTIERSGKASLLHRLKR